MRNNQLSTDEKELLASLKTGRTREEVFKNIVASIRESYEGKMTEQKAKQPARGFIGFCQKIIDVQIRLEREEEAIKEEQN